MEKGKSPFRPAAMSSKFPSGEPWVTAWLVALTLAVAAMVSVGGVVRLTGSGLSMAEWRPLTGWLPPLSDTEWQRVFGLYRETPEYRTINAGMDLAGFRAIFWWEYAHRVMGRLLGVLFVLPLLAFWATGRLPRPVRPRLLMLLALGTLQGGVGWWMVRSGLVDRPEVSAARLAVHLGLALAIFSLLLWTVLERTAPREGRVRPNAWGPLVLIAVTILSGALVAGNDGGLIHNSFPLVNGALWPDDYATGAGLLSDAISSPVATQMHHRVMATATTVAVAAVWVLSGGPGSGLPNHMLLAATGLQAGLGVLTLLSVADPTLSILHQAGAVLLLSAALWRTHSTRAPVGACRQRKFVPTHPPPVDAGRG